MRVDMNKLTAMQARTNLDDLIKKVATKHEPVTISTKTHSAVLVSEQGWSGMKETLYLMSIPTMWASIEAGIIIPSSKCIRWEELGW